MNAKELEEVGACRIVTEEEFSKERILLEIDKLFDHKDQYDQMKIQSRSLGITDSATKIYDELRKLIG